MEQGTRQPLFAMPHYSTRNIMCFVIRVSAICVAEGEASHCLLNGSCNTSCSCSRNRTKTAGEHSAATTDSEFGELLNYLKATGNVPHVTPGRSCHSFKKNPTYFQNSRPRLSGSGESAQIHSMVLLRANNNNNNNLSEKSVRSGVWFTWKTLATTPGSNC